MTATEKVLFWLNNRDKARQYLAEGKDRAVNLEIIRLAEMRLEELRRNPAR